MNKHQNYTGRYTNLKPFLYYFIVSIFYSFHFSPSAHAQIIGDDVYESLKQNDRAAVIVTLKNIDDASTSIAERSMLISKNVNSVLDSLSESEFELIVSFSTFNAFSGYLTLGGLEKLASDSRVESVSLDQSGNGGLFRSVPFIKGDVVRNFGFTGKGVVVGILDTGVDTDHPDLSDDIIDQHCFCRNADNTGCCPNGSTEQSGPGSAEDDNRHGTNIAGIITSNGSVASLGVAPDAKIIPVKVIDSDNFFASTTQILQGMEWLLLNHPEVDVINMSLGTNTLFSGFCDNVGSGLVFKAILNAMKANGTIVVASTQNDSSNSRIAAPACLSTSVAVSAVYDRNEGETITFGCRNEVTGRDIVPCFVNTSVAVDLLAPGLPIESSGLNGSTSSLAGTSQAAAHVTGAAAVLLEANPLLSPDTLKAVLKATGVIVTDPKNGLSFSRVNLLAATNTIIGTMGEICGDGLDNNGNGKIDCLDESCDGIVGPGGFRCEFRDETICSDGFDNDVDSDIDFEDNDCKERSGLVEGGGCHLSTRGRTNTVNAAVNMLIFFLILSIPAMRRLSII